MTGIIRILFTYISIYQSQITQKISAAINKPIEIKKIKSYWEGFHPWVELEEVVIFENQHQTKILQRNKIQINKIKLKLNILSSLYHKQVIPHSFIIDGTHLQIKQLPDKKILINGIPYTFPQLADKSENLYKDLRYEFKSIDFTWQGQNESTISLRNLHIFNTQEITKIQGQNIEVYLPNVFAKTVTFDFFSTDMNVTQENETSKILLSNLQLKKFKCSDARFYQFYYSPTKRPVN